MKLIFIILYLTFLSNSGFSQDIFKTNDHILKFESNNITLDREKNINEIKIKSFKNILSNILSSSDPPELFILIIDRKRKSFTLSKN